MKKKLIKRKLTTKQLKKKYLDMGYQKYMPFGNFRLLANRCKL